MRYNSMGNLFLVKFLIIIFFLSFPVLLFAAPYGPVDRNTVYDRLYESDLVLYGKILRKTKDDKGGAMTEFEVYNNIKGGIWKKGDFFYLNETLNQPVNTIGILYAYRSVRNGVNFYELNVFYPDKNARIYNYTKKIYDFLTSGDNEGRLRWLYSQVDSNNSFIAWDSYAELGLASYEDLKKAAPAIDRESLIYLTGLAGVQDHRKSFYVFLLGLARNKVDLPFVKRIIENPSNKDSKILYGAFMAYGLLSDNYPEYFLKKMNSPASRNLKLAVLEAVKNLMLYERPKNVQPMLKSLYAALKSGDDKLIFRAVQISRELKIPGPMKYMRAIYFNNFADNPIGRIEVINYLKIVRKITPDAVKLLEEIKKKEKNPKVRSKVDY